MKEVGIESLKKGDVITLISKHTYPTKPSVIIAEVIVDKILVKGEVSLRILKIVSDERNWYRDLDGDTCKETWIDENERIFLMTRNEVIMELL